MVLKHLDKIYQYLKLEILFISNRSLYENNKKKNTFTMFPCYVVIRYFKYANRRLIFFFNYGDLMLN